MKKQYYLNLLLISIWFLQACSPSDNTMNTVASPDGSIRVDVRLSQGQPYYRITKDNDVVLDTSKLGIRMLESTFDEGLSLVNISESESVTDSYTLKYGKQQDITYEANRKVYHFTNSKEERMDIIFQVSDDGVAFRYFFPDSTNTIRHISSELTAFHLPENSRAWMQPCAEAKSGWARSNPSYEENYVMDVPVGTEAPGEAGWVYPALFKSGSQWVLISEAGLDDHYCATRLKQKSPGGIYQVGFPQPEEVIFDGALNPQSTGPWYTPWRIVAVGNLKTVVESTLGTDVAKPAIEGDFGWVKPGRASWSWVMLKDDSVVYDVQKKFIDYAADMGWEYCLIDNYWDQKIGYDKIQELVNYADSRNVGIILWYNSAGDWNDTPQTPQDRMLTHDSRMREFEKIKKMGVKGVKVDFFGGDGQSVIQYYHQILRDAATAKLMANFHGCTLPRGWERTYPNLVSMESVKGMEFITFEQANADLALTHCAVLPFTRNVFDPMDFTPVCFSEIPNIDRLSSNAFELALPVLFTSGVQHFAETPEGMSRVPDFVQKVMQQMPVAWDESHFIAGYPGKYVVMARQHDGRWYVAGINATEDTQKMTLEMSFLAGCKGYIITDGADNRSFEQQALTIPEDGDFELTIEPHGGFLMQLSL